MSLKLLHLYNIENVSSDIIVIIENDKKKRFQPIRVTSPD